jgi:CobQ-like glutamine amidotransferase family enzyme
MKQLNLNIGWLYPEYMSTYGDRGNVICLKKRSEWRGINADVKPIEFNTSLRELEQCNIILGGGAQDRQQELVAEDLREKKGKTLHKMFKRNIPGLFVCGSPQLLGHYYMTGKGKKLQGLGFFDFVTRHFGNDKPRCIGDTIGEISSQFSVLGSQSRKTIVGFENHGGRTYLGKNCRPFAKVLKGYGNNGEDGYEGAVYKNVIACY